MTPGHSSTPGLATPAAAMTMRALTIAAIAALAALAAIALPGAASVRADEAGIPPDELTETFSIPLQQGQVNLGRLMGDMVDRVGFDGSMLRGAVDWQIDVTGALGLAKLAALKQVTGGYMALDVKDDELLVTVDRLKLRRDEKQMRGRFRKLMVAWFPEEAAAAAAGFGTVVHRSGAEPARLDQAKLGDSAVVLVHGLDDPGRLWEQVAPALLTAGHTVCEFTYPNDQPIVDSAGLLARALIDLRAHGVRRVDIVAHSMGGLVSRELLTSPQFYNGRGVGHAVYPDVTHLIMVGTPNHGSQCARLDVTSELREQTIRLFSGDGLLFGSIVDGAGEARVDLLPRSEFLLRLNNRPNPPDVKMTIIAGRASPVSQVKIDKFKTQIASQFPQQRSQVDAIAEACTELSDGLGDGVVPIESARLTGVSDFVVVQANHISMLHQPSDNGDTPPAIPIIVERLKDE